MWERPGVKISVKKDRYHTNNPLSDARALPLPLLAAGSGSRALGQPPGTRPHLACPPHPWAAHLRPARRTCGAAVAHHFARKLRSTRERAPGRPLVLESRQKRRTATLGTPTAYPAGLAAMARREVTCQALPEADLRTFRSQEGTDG